MDYEKCKCPICDKDEIMRKEIEPSRFVFECQTCGKFCVSRETLELKEDLIRDNRQRISSALKKITNGGITTEIVLHDGQIKNLNQRTFEMIDE